MRICNQSFWAYVYSFLCITFSGLFWINQGILMSSCSGGGGDMSFRYGSKY